MCIVIEHLLVIRYKLRMLGMEVEKCSTLLEDNNSVIINTQLSSSKLKKNHNFLAFHKAREAVAAGFLQTGHIDSNQNVCGILMNSLSFVDLYNLTGYIFHIQFPKYGVTL